MTAGGATTRYALDVAGGLPEVIAASGGATTQYLQVQGQVLAQYDSGTWGYVAPDALPALGPQAQVGSVRQVINPAGAVALAQSYDPFGNPLSSAGTGSSVFGYTGEQMDASTGLLYLRARYYGSGTGRFLSKDPWKGDDLRPQSLNGWSYVEGNPINRIDPRGRCYGPATFLRSIPGERELCENLDLAIIISTHPGATEQQKEQARAYITLWWVGHSTLVAGSAYLAFYGYTQLAQFIALSKEVAEQGCPPPPASPPLYEPLPDQQPLPSEPPCRINRCLLTSCRQSSSRRWKKGQLDRQKKKNLRHRRKWVLSSAGTREDMTGVGRIVGKYGCRLLCYAGECGRRKKLSETWRRERCQKR
jgi:RHS repeat-associated protein